MLYVWHVIFSIEHYKCYVSVVAVMKAMFKKISPSNVGSLLLRVRWELC